MMVFFSYKNKNRWSYLAVFVVFAASLTELLVNGVYHMQFAGWEWPVIGAIVVGVAGFFMIRALWPKIVGSISSVDTSILKARLKAMNTTLRLSEQSNQKAVIITPHFMKKTSASVEGGHMSAWHQSIVEQLSMEYFKRRFKGKKLDADALEECRKTLRGFKGMENWRDTELNGFMKANYISWSLEKDEKTKMWKEFMEGKLRVWHNDPRRQRYEQENLEKIKIGGKSFEEKLKEIHVDEAPSTKEVVYYLPLFLPPSKTVGHYDELLQTFLTTDKMHIDRLIAIGYTSMKQIKRVLNSLVILEEREKYLKFSFEQILQGEEKQTLDRLQLIGYSSAEIKEVVGGLADDDDNKTLYTTLLEKESGVVSADLEEQKSGEAQGVDTDIDLRGEGEVVGHWVLLVFTKDTTFYADPQCLSLKTVTQLTHKPLVGNTSLQRYHDQLFPDQPNKTQIVDITHVENGKVFQTAAQGNTCGDWVEKFIAYLIENNSCVKQNPLEGLKQQAEVWPTGWERFKFWVGLGGAKSWAPVRLLSMPTKLYQAGEHRWTTPFQAPQDPSTENSSDWDQSDHVSRLPNQADRGMDYLQDVKRNEIRNTRRG